LAGKPLRRKRFWRRQKKRIKEKEEDADEQGDRMCLMKMAQSPSEIAQNVAQSGHN
jgi:hypothetical protein